MPTAATTTGAHRGVQRRTATARRTSRPMSSLPLLSLVTMFTGSRWYATVATKVVKQATSAARGTHRESHTEASTAIAPARAPEQTGTQSPTKASMSKAGSKTIRPRTSSKTEKRNNSASAETRIRPGQLR